MLNKERFNSTSDKVFRISEGEDREHAVKEGVMKLLDVVGSTMGYGGKTVIIERNDTFPLITKDGVTVSRAFALEDPVENMAVQIIKDSAEKTLKEAGDGTTTSIVLASNMFLEGIEILNEDGNEHVDIIDFREGFRDAIKKAIEILKKESIKIECQFDSLYEVALVSTNHDEDLAKVIAEALTEVGKDGIVTVELTSELEDKIELEEGYVFKNGIPIPEFINNKEEMSCKLEDVKVLVLGDTLPSIEPIESLILETAKNKTPLAILAPDFGDTVIPTLALNYVKTGLQVVPVRLPGIGEDKIEYAKDISVYTDAVYISSTTGIRFEDITYQMLGDVKSMSMDLETTLMKGAKGAANDTIQYNERKDIIKKQLELETSELKISRLEERLGQLTGKSANIKLSSKTLMEFREKKDRFHDAISACRSALEEGVVAGSGLTLKLIADSIVFEGKDQSISYYMGADVVLYALNQPFYRVCKNAGYESTETLDIMISSYIKENFAGDSGSAVGKVYFDLEEGELKTVGKDKSLYDPTKVERVALENSSSVALLLLTSDYIMYRV